MTTLNTKKLAVALLVMAGAFIAAAPASQADEPEAVAYGPAPSGNVIKARFTYDRDAPAEKIYSDLKVTARDACRASGVRSIVIRKLEQRCIKQMLDSGVAQFGRADIAQLHQGRIAVANR